MSSSWYSELTEESNSWSSMDVSLNDTKNTPLMYIFLSVGVMATVVLYAVWLHPGCSIPLYKKYKERRLSQRTNELTMSIV